MLTYAAPPPLFAVRLSRRHRRPLVTTFELLILGPFLQRGLAILAGRECCDSPRFQIDSISHAFTSLVLFLVPRESQVKNRCLRPCLKELGLTRQAHCQVLIAGFLSNVVLPSFVVDVYAKCGEIFNLLLFEIAFPESNSSKIDDLRTRKTTQISNPCYSLSKKEEDLLLSAHQVLFKLFCLFLFYYF
ncbi:hypothetical protein U1Q18_040881 [Sarracenia purpurea var. burkii]